MAKTLIEKLKELYPDMVEDEIVYYHCPEDFPELNATHPVDSIPCPVDSIPCVDCWNREVEDAESND